MKLYVFLFIIISFSSVISNEMVISSETVSPTTQPKRDVGLTVLGDSRCLMQKV